jgi:UDP-N-acetylglucosamine--N-acetylmuramyl-(pentapeptide) pyrophosphoryl-undecaprenol N-acetylglucosamine transferase
MASTNKEPWFVIAGGGTGGHLYPGLAVAEALRKLAPKFDVAVFGTTRPIDKQLTESRGYELVAQEVRPFPARPLQWPGFLLAWRRSLRFAKARFAERAPAIVLGLGGYAAGPPIVTAAKLGIPTALFNPDAVPGRANQTLAPRVDKVFVQWDATIGHFPRARSVVCTGCPIRATFMSTKREDGIRALKLSDDKKTLLVTGASQGAASINTAMMELLDLWRVAADWQIVHLTGSHDFELCRGKYKDAGIDARLLSYTEHMPLCMAVADLVISRAGASTLAEITAMGKPSVLMPYPFDKKQHQKANAMVLVESHAAEMVEDTNDARDNARRLREVLRDLMRSDQRRNRMAHAAAVMGRADAAETIATELLEMARM